MSAALVRLQAFAAALLKAFPFPCERWLPAQPARRTESVAKKERAQVAGRREAKKARTVRAVDESDTRTAKAVFLREAHTRACRIFGTVLGPEANNAHRNHFHVDLAPRKRSNFCE